MHSYAITVEEELGAMSGMARKTCTSTPFSPETTFDTLQRQDTSWASSLGYSTGWHLYAGRWAWLAEAGLTVRVQAGCGWHMGGVDSGTWAEFTVAYGRSLVVHGRDLQWHMGGV